MVKNLPANSGDTVDTQVPSLGRVDPLEQEMATGSSIFAGIIPWTEEPGRLQSMGSHESQTRLKRLSMHTRSQGGKAF